MEKIAVAMRPPSETEVGSWETANAHCNTKAKQQPPPPCLAGSVRNLWSISP